MNFKHIYLFLVLSGTFFLRNLFQTLIMSMRKTTLALGQLLRSVHIKQSYLKVAPGQWKTHVNSYRRQTMHWGKSWPRGQWVALGQWVVPGSCDQALRGVPGKIVKFKHHRYMSGTAFRLQKRLQVIKSALLLTRIETLTILSPICEAESPENVRKWSLWKHVKKTGTDNKRNASKNSPART